MSPTRKNKKLPPPKSVSISITGKCNLKCNYCFYANEMAGLKDLPTGTWLKFFAELGEIGIMDASLTGGEALLRPDIFELIDGIIANRMRYNLLSNGTLIDEKLLKKFEHGKRRLRLDYIQVSIDGSTAAIHNQSRPGSFDKAIRGLKLLKEAGFPGRRARDHQPPQPQRPGQYRQTVAGRYRLEFLRHQRGHAHRFGLPQRRRHVPVPKRKNGSHGRHRPLAAALPGPPAGPGRARRPSARCTPRWSMPGARARSRKTWTMGYLTSCGCVFSKIDILHDGSVVPCCMLPGLVLGNICSDSLLDIWHNHPTMKALRERRSIPMSEVPGCETCEWNQYLQRQLPGPGPPVDRRFQPRQSRGLF